MRRSIASLLFFAAPVIFEVSVASAAVALTAEVDGEQPTGGVIVIKVTMTNNGMDSVHWWNGGPDTYPGAEHFVVDARAAHLEDWQRINATNGQHSQGSGGDRELKAGESIVVPLAVPFKRGSDDNTDLRITSAKWKVLKPVELYVRSNQNRSALDARRARMIAAALPDAPPFWRHVAEAYADPVVIDAMLKLVTVDNAPVVEGAARILAAQPQLSENAGGVLVPIVALWLPRDGQGGGVIPGYYLLSAGLKSQSESVRQVALDMLRDSRDAKVRGVLIDALRLSPGDQEWLYRVHGRLVDVSNEKVDAPELVRQARDAAAWVESKLTRLREKNPTTQNTD